MPLTLEGTARQTREVAPEIVMDDTDKTVLRILGNTSGRDYDGSLEDVTVRNLEFSRTKMGNAQSDTVLVENTIYTTFENVGFSLSQNGLRAVNCNGLRINTCHGTSGGDIAGEEVRGIYIDGAEKGSAGILITDYIYYGYASPNSITYAYKDYNGEKATGTNVGDRRITNFECAGDVNYGIAIISDSSGWAGDIAISAVSMNSVRTAGIYLYAKEQKSYQQANISNTFFRLSKEKAQGVSVDTFCNVNIANLTVENAVSGGKNTAVSLKNTTGGTITSTAFTGEGYDCIVSYDKCSGCVFTGNTSISGGMISVVSSKNCIVSSNSMVKAKYVEADSTDCVTGLNIFAENK